MTQTKTVKTAAILFLLPALLLGACGQSAGTPTAVSAPTAVTPTPTPAAVATNSSLSLSVFLPDAVSGQSVRPQYVSGATTSLRVQLGSFDTTLALSSAACSAVTGGQTCTFSLNVVPGAGQTLTVSAYDSSSRLLGVSTQTVGIIAGQDNALSLVLTGVAASATFTATDRAADITPGAAGSLLLDLGGSYSVGIALKDAANQTILNPGRPTETLTSSNVSFAVNSTGVGTFTVSAPTPTGADQSTTLTVKDAGGRTLATQVLTVPAQKLALSLSTTSPVAGSTLLATARLTSARGQALAASGRVVTFGVTGGSLPGTSTASTDATGSASLNVTAGNGSAAVTATSDAVTASAAYTGTAANTGPGPANATTSSVSLSQGAVKVNGQSTLTVTLKDSNNAPVTTVPTITVSGKSTVGAVSQNGNVFTYAVTAAAAPETATFTVTSGGNTVGATNLAVTAYPLTVSDGAAALVSGTARFDFQNGGAHTFAVAESGYTGSFTVTSSNAAVATASVSGGVLTVTPGHTAGFSTVIVQDSFGQSFKFTVSVTTASLVIN